MSSPEEIREEGPLEIHRDANGVAMIRPEDLDKTGMEGPDETDAAAEREEKAFYERG